MDFLNDINGYIWHQNVLYVVLGTAVLFTVWSFFGQYRALTHGIAVIRGKYDDESDPGAINHFQALSAALSATVGLGNIGGVAVAIALGGPGAVFWMWVIGLFGMALKMTEVTLSMLYRNTDDPENPHGGPMWVAMKGFKEIDPKFGLLGKFVGGLFCVTLLISSVTGGNMFQAWNVSKVTLTYFSIPEIVTGIILALTVGAVILGGIKRIGAVAGRIVPFMCLAYMMAAIYVVANYIGDVPTALSLIVTSAFNPLEAQGAFIGGTFGYALLWGMKRALFSSEVGQGSSPIAHSAAKTNEPVREGIVAGLEPFIDTLVVCTLTSMVILLTGTWKREAAASFAQAPTWKSEIVESKKQWTLDDATLPTETSEAWVEGNSIYMIARAGANDETGNNLVKIEGNIVPSGANKEALAVTWKTKIEHASQPILASNAIYANYPGATLTAKSFDRVQDGLGKWLVTLAAWLFAISTIISWSYYGEQGVVYLFGEKSVFLYRVIYCGLVVVACLGFIKTDSDLDALTAMGTGVMLIVNIPLTLFFGKKAMDAYHAYSRRLKEGTMEKPHAARRLADMMEEEE